MILFPYKLSYKLPENTVQFEGVYSILFLTSFTDNSDISFPIILRDPVYSILILVNNLNKVLFPEPLGPSINILSALSISKLKLFATILSMS